MNSRTGFSVEESRPLLRHSFLEVDEITISTPAGESVQRVIVRHPGAVGVVARQGDDVILLRQYRAAVDDYVLEIPAGKLDVPGEDPLLAASRELAEETGYRARSFTHLTDILTTVGFSDEVISLYLATDCEVGEANPVGAEEAAAEIVVMPWSEAVASVVSGSIADAKSIAGILIADAHNRSA